MQKASEKAVEVGMQSVPAKLLADPSLISEDKALWAAMGEQMCSEEDLDLVGAEEAGGGKAVRVDCGDGDVAAWAPAAQPTIFIDLSIVDEEDETAPLDQEEADTDEEFSLAVDDVVAPQGKASRLTLTDLDLDLQ